MAAVGVSQLYETSYKNAYKTGDILPPLKYHQAPSFHLTKEQPSLERREFPLIPQGPHRRINKTFALGPGLGTKDLKLKTEQYLDSKPIVRTAPPKEIFHEKPSKLLKRRKSAKGRRSPANKETWYQALSYPTVPVPPTFNINDAIRLPPAQDSNVKTEKEPSKLDDMLNEITWTTTLKRATETEDKKLKERMIEPPCSTYEDNCDMVKYRPIKYDPTRQMWQDVAEFWDKVQNRAITNKPVEHKISLKPSKYKFIRSQNDTAAMVEEKINKLAVTDNFTSCYTRPCPGYAGFVPRSPIQKPLKKRQIDLRKDSIMKSSYRRFPTEEYQLRQFAHKGPMSRTVTLTYPYNPFNKHEKHSK